MLIILHLNLKKHHIFLDGLLLDIKQWGSCYIQKGNNKVEATMPISWGKWGLICFTGLMTQGLFIPIKWDDQAINRNSSKAIFRAENNVSLTTWVSYLYIGF